MVRKYIALMPGRKGIIMEYISISAPARLDGKSTFNIVVDIDHDKIELCTADEKSVVSLDLICAADFARALHDLSTAKIFRPL